MKIPRALTIAGSDSGGGAGIQADLKTFSAYGVFGMSAITSITAQNTQGVYGIFDLPPDFVEKQIRVVIEDIGVDAVKTGMLSNSEIIEAVARTLKNYKIPFLVVDPVMRAKGGDPLLREDAQDALIHEILPMATIVTPNIPEAEVLSGISPIDNIDDMKEAARRIIRLGPENVIVKGGHLEGKAIDVFYDGRNFQYFESERIETKNTHGTGCTFASAIAAGLAKGMKLKEAVLAAKSFVTGAISNSLDIGKGHGPVNHVFQIKPSNVEFDEFTKLDIRVGTVIEAEPLKGAIIPAYALKIDFGPEVGFKKSSARITRYYKPEELIGKQVIAVINFKPKIIAGFKSEVLVLGVMEENGGVVLLRPDRKVEDGLKIG